MAINIGQRYPTKTEADPAYPLGKARNVTTPGDQTGTPWRSDVINDILGFQQAIHKQSGFPIVGTGTPETADASQYLEGIKSIILGLAAESALINTTGRTVAKYTNGGTPDAPYAPSADGVSLGELTLNATSGNLNWVVSGLVSTPPGVFFNVQAWSGIGAAPSEWIVSTLPNVIGTILEATVRDATTGALITAIPARITIELNYDRAADLP
jgi:hypothetical protein